MVDCRWTRGFDCRATHTVPLLYSLRFSARNALTRSTANSCAALLNVIVVFLALDLTRTFAASSQGRRWVNLGLSAAPRRLDRGDVDFRHIHHRIKRAFGFSAAGRHRLGQHTRRDLPGNAPFVLAPTARTFLTAIADDRLPVAIGFFLIVRRDLEGEGFGMFERRGPPLMPRQGMPPTVNSTVSTSPALPDG